MRIRDLLLGFISGVAGFIIFGVIGTEAASQYLAFSVLVGLPAGIIGGLVLWMATYRWLGHGDPDIRSGGLTLAVFGGVFLALAIVAVVIAGLRNSHALPIAGVGSILVTTAVYVWSHRRERPIPQ